ncbi:penicillin acylase family protein [Mongoliitalea daihaiensis]|uniref:penicillin acylase family protein n=1 Tax=Mongoliitalea daihaiensis TaxID=2782006 RepID=UPI001F1A02E6|nr:penicillin acylase family protein [Mongoliitalea daihaiensis]UJP66359.1 penicillin acylase family protein [Mongoliitalea daihaiensis]
MLRMHRLSAYSILLVLIGSLYSCGQLSYEYSGYDISNIQIARDFYGVPHIFGKSDADVVYGLAWSHAEDDFETIQQTLLAGKAMVGRVFGENGAAVDYFVHLLETREIAANKYETDFSPPFKALVKAYLAAMNDFALAYPERILLPAAFPVSETDIISAYILSLAQMSGADEAVKKIVNGTLEIPEVKDPSAGSNAIAIHPALTDSGEAFLAINSHQPLTGPVAWYEAHLCSEEGWNALGGLFPGGLTIFHGINEHLGWAHTVNYPDKLDVFQLKMHPSKKLHYEVDGEYLVLEEKRVWLKVRLWDFITVPIPKKVWKSIFGPTLVTDQGTFSIKTGSLEIITAPEQWYHMNKAKNFHEFSTAMNQMALPGFNTVYADKYDTIFYVSNALLPVRNPQHDYSKTILGDSKSKLWDSYYPFSALPQQINPTSGYLFNTNHSPFKATDPTSQLDPTNYEPQMGYLLTENNRSIRLAGLLLNQEAMSYETFKAIKFDKTLPDSLLYELNVNPLFKLDANKYPAIAKSIQALQAWDRSADANSVGAAYFAYIYYFLRDRTTELTLDPKRTLSEEEAILAIESAQTFFLTAFEQFPVTLGEYQKLVRGEQEMPLFGLPDVIAAMRSEPLNEKTRKGEQGESYIMMVRFGEGLPIVETINVYGASNQQDNPHYADQMGLFARQKLKPMILDKDVVLKSAQRIYKPKKQ